MLLFIELKAHRAGYAEQGSGHAVRVFIPPQSDVFPVFLMMARSFVVDRRGSIYSPATLARTIIGLLLTHDIDGVEHKFFDQKRGEALQNFPFWSFARWRHFRKQASSGESFFMG